MDEAGKKVKRETFVVVRTEFFAKLARLYGEWAEEAAEHGGVLLLRPEFVVLDMLELVGQDSTEVRRALLGARSEDV